jgi:hypothetical protein
LAIEKPPFWLSSVACSQYDDEEEGALLTLFSLV